MSISPMPCTARTPTGAAPSARPCRRRCSRTLRADNTYWAAFRGPVSQASESVYDAFLKTNGDASGIRSYGMVTDLLVTYFADAEA